MRQIVSGQRLTTTIVNAPPGLVGTIGYRILEGLDPLDLGATVVARTTLGIVESPANSGFYMGRTAPLLLAAGPYVVLWDTDPAGVVTPANSGSESFEVVVGVDVDLTALPAQPGPGLTCSLWFDPADLVARHTADTPPLGLDEAQRYAAIATDALYSLTLQQWTGICPAIARPCSRSTGWCGWDTEPGMDYRCACGYVPRVRLAGPVIGISQVTVDGIVLDPATYRVDYGEWLVRLDGNAWPLCQNMLADDDAPGSFTVTYVHGAIPPQLAQWAALELADWLVGQFPNAGQCSPAAVISGMQRQGVTYTFDRKKLAEIGLGTVDMLLKTYNPSSVSAAPMVYSPGIEPTARI